jgi:hypothetical protein
MRRQIGLLSIVGFFGLLVRTGQPSVNFYSFGLFLMAEITVGPYR